MANISVLELDALWAEFHSVVNMTSQQLSAWLQAEAAAEDSEQPPEQPGSATGEQVLAILQKRRMDLTDEDVQVMYEVVDAVEAERDARRAARREHGLTAAADDEQSRRRLMRMGHDLRKPV
jgi:hypothetical protein